MAKSKGIFTTIAIYADSETVYQVPGINSFIRDHEAEAEPEYAEYEVIEPKQLTDASEPRINEDARGIDEPAG